MVMDHPWEIVSNNDLFKRSKFAIGPYKREHAIIAGGWDVRGEKLNSVVLLDLQTGTFKSLPDLPAEYDGCTGANVNGYFYMVGRNDTMYRINLSCCSKWEKLTAVDFDFGHGHALISDGRHLFWPGGVLNNRTFNLYEPDSNTWKTLPQMTTPRYGHATAIVGQKIYIIGGADDRNALDLSSVEVFDIPTRTWSSAPDLPIAVYYPAATTLGRWIVVTGGLYSDERETSYCFVFDTFGREWIQSRVSLPSLRYGHGCVTMQDSQIIVVGGSRSRQKGNPIVTISRKHLIPNWYFVKDFLLLRRLLEEGRAQMKAPIFHSKDGNEIHSTRKFIRALGQFFLTLDLDTFRTVLSFV